MREMRDVAYADTYECRKLDVFLPDCEEFPVFIYFHGGSLECGDKGDVAELVKYLTSRNIAVVSANYRMYPEAEYPDFLKDGALAVSWVYKNISEYGKCTGFYIGGSSAGGYISMMLCFDKKYLAVCGIDAAEVDGFVHDAGQPTAHFNVMRERGLDTRRVIIDESAPIYHVGASEKYAPMYFIVSDNDLENRYEQTMLMLSTLKHFEYDQSKIKHIVMHGGHCEYVGMLDENGESVFGRLVYDYIAEQEV